MFNNNYTKYIWYIIYAFIGIYTIKCIYDNNIYTYVDYEQWKTLLNGKQLYIFNDHKYCVKNKTDLFYNYYICCQNIHIVKNNLDISILNNNTKSNKELIKYVSETKSYDVIMTLFVITSITLYLFITLIYKIFFGAINFIFSGLKFIGTIQNMMGGNNKNLKIDFLPKQIQKQTPEQTQTQTQTQEKTQTSEQISHSIYETNSTSTYDVSSFIDKILGTNEQIEVKSNKDPSASIDNFIGCNNIKRDINKLILQINYESIYKSNTCELPKGMLLLGPPGVGKTYLVKTIINSTGMKHIFISGSDFNKKFVGSGSSTVSKMFKKARENKPCLIFIDEADAILKKRSHSESSSASLDFNSTVCKFLEEMDSLKTESGVIVIFASNMDIEHIDKGLIRAGRVDQIINITYPTFEERIDLFKMYLNDLYIDTNIDINKIAKLSYGLTGSDIKKIINMIKINKVHSYVESNCDELKKCNESKIPTNHDNKIEIVIKTDDIDKEISKSIMGMERERKVNVMNKKIIAYHEAGHAVLGFLIKDSIIPTKICISINSKSLGYTLFPQDDDDLLVKTTISQLLIDVMILYGGRMSEKIFIGDVTCGGEDDYLKARKILKRLLLNGMLILENNYIDYGEKDLKLTQPMEEHLKKINKIIIDEINLLLNNNSDIVHKISNMIMEHGSIISDDIYEIFKTHNVEEKIGSYNISNVIDKIKNLEFDTTTYSK